jgi:hypothetical protein
MNRLNRWISLLLVLILGCLLGILGCSIWDKSPTPVEPISWSSAAQWVGSPEQNYRFYLRRNFSVADTVKTAWVRFSSDSDFIFYVNGQAIAHERQVLYHSLGLANRRSEKLQRINDSIPYRSRGYDWIHISIPNNWKLATYLDLTPYLRPGKNTIALEIQKGRKDPRVVLEGAVSAVEVTGATINLSTGATEWKVSNLFESRQGLLWFDPAFPDESWPDAKIIGPVREAIYSRVSQHLFDRSLTANWITGTESEQGQVWLRGSWKVTGSRQRAFIRLAGDGEYSLLINGLLVNRFPANDRNQLHMYEVTNFLHPGENTLAVRLARNLDRDWTVRTNGVIVQNDTLDFLLDGWVENSKGEIVDAIATNNSWISLTEPIAGWDTGAGSGQTATMIGTPDRQEFQRRFAGNAYLLNYPDHLLHQSLWILGGIGCTFVYTWSLGQFWLGRNNGWDSLAAGAGLLLPGTLFLIGIGLLKHRYAEAERGLLFCQAKTDIIVLLGFVAIAVLSLLWSQFQPALKDSTLARFPRWGLWFILGSVAFAIWGLATTGIPFDWLVNLAIAATGFGSILVLPIIWSQVISHSSELPQTVREKSIAWGKWILLILIVGIGFGLRAYNLDFVSLESDESTSYDAIKGILRTGAPEAISGIWYTRSPAYHYITALWLLMVGDTPANARFLSVMWGVATLVLVFIFTREITGKTWIALVAIAIVALDPSELRFSRFIRFYQGVEFMNILSFWAFFKGFIDREGRKYQYLFFIAITLTVLHQEVTLTVLPCFLMGFLFFYRPFRLKDDWPIIASCLTFLVIFIYDLAFFVIKCLTPLVGLTDNPGANVKLHLYNVTGFINNFLVGPSRMHILYSFFFFAGLIYFLYRRNEKLVFLYGSILLNLIFVTILVPLVATRYLYQFQALFIVLAVYGAIVVTESLARKFEFILQNRLPLQGFALACVALLLFSNIELERIFAGYYEQIARQNNEVYEYIRQHRQPGDVVIAPSPPGAAVVLGGLDYFIPGAIAFDVPYWRDGRVLDRWGGGVLISNLDQFRRVLEKSQRVWLNLDDHTLGRFKPTYLQYLQTLGKPVMEGFGTRLRLWQREDGILPSVPNQGKDLGVY